MDRMTRPALVAVATILLAMGAAPLSAQTQGGPTPSPGQLEAWRRILAVEDARVETRALREELRSLIWSNDQLVASLALRAAGRTESPAGCTDAIPLLVSTDSTIRSVAASSVAQCYVKQPNMALTGILGGLARAESNQASRGRIATAIGRMTYESETDLRLAEDMLLSLLGPMPSGNVGGPDLRTPPAELVTGVLTGLEALERRHAKLAPPSAAVVELATRVIHDQAEHDRDATAEAQWALARRLALQVLLTGRATTLAAVDAALGDPDAQVRRLAAIAVGREDPLRQDALRRALHDSSGPVRYAVLSQLGRRGDATISAHCEALLDLVQDEDTHVALLAIDLTSSCKGNDRAIATVAAEVDQRTRTASGSETGGREAGRPRWHRPAHALISLATLAPARAVDAVPQLAADPAWQVRMYTARAAALTGQLDVLRRLGQDAHDNVREAAIAALSTRGPREADALCLEALTRDDYQLLITAARVLEGTPRRADARAALLGALDRISSQQRETSRDARHALIERLAELGDSADAARLEPYLSDFDPAIAAAAASLLARWTGQPRTATPKPLPRLLLPTADQLADLFHTRVVLHLRGLGDVELRLLATDAPLNAFRFVRLAGAGYYDGLTFHRVVPGFVIQGGSPGANEYSGDGPFTRDEIGVPNRRGSVGLSTRGRDTGDAQFYVNLVDNYRLDEDYTVFAEVVRGMDLIDRILEGDVIERAVVVRP